MDASQLPGAYEAMTSSDFSKQPRRYNYSTQQHSSTAAAVQHAAAAVQAVAFVAATVFCVCAGSTARSWQEDIQPGFQFI